MGKKKRKQGAPRSRQLSERKLGVLEASGVAALGDDRFLVADDEHGVFLWEENTTPKLVGQAIKGDLEGICVSADGSTAYVLCERRGTVWQADVKPGGLHNERALGSLPRLGERNRGWEGITCATSHWSAQPALLAVHQRDPRVLGLFALPSLEEIGNFALPKHKRLRKQMGDRNDIAIEPSSGDVLLLCGRKGVIARFALSDGALSPVRLHRIATAGDDVPEGMAFDAAGALWVVTDGRGHLRQLQLD